MILYLGIQVPSSLKKEVLHIPLIEPLFFSEEKILPYFSWENLQKYSHFLFTSQTAVSLFFSFLKKQKIPLEDLKEKKWIAVGPSTQKKLEEKGFLVEIPNVYSQEGIIQLLFCKKDFSLFWPRSFLARRPLLAFLEKRKVLFQAPSCYTLKYKTFSKKIFWEEITGVVFTSPSTVEAFLQTQETPIEKIPFFFQGEPTKQVLQRNYPCRKIFSVSTLLSEKN